MICYDVSEEVLQERLLKRGETSGTPHHTALPHNHTTHHTPHYTPLHRRPHYTPLHRRPR